MATANRPLRISRTFRVAGKRWACLASSAEKCTDEVTTNEGIELVFPAALARRMRVGRMYRLTITEVRR